MDAFRTMIVTAAIAPAVRALAATWDGGTNMFTTPCLTGEEVTHYLSTGLISGTTAQWLPHTDYSGEEPVEYPGDLDALVESINADNPEAGATVEGITALLAGADVSTQEWPDALARLGLTLGEAE